VHHAGVVVARQPRAGLEAGIEDPDALAAVEKERVDVDAGQRVDDFPVGVVVDRQQAVSRH
jgi:hypothetical protein